MALSPGTKKYRPKGLTYIKHKDNPTSFKKGFTPWTKGKNKKDYPQLGNSGRRVSGVPWKEWIGSTCIDCGKNLTSKSKRCISCYSLHRRGENHWNWKGGITPFEHSERVRFRRTIQKQVFERDNYTCQICGTKGGHLQVDHIQSWSEYIELRFSIDNCRTLCMDCHYKLTFGKPRPKQIKAWGHNLKEVQGL